MIHIHPNIITIFVSLSKCQKEFHATEYLMRFGKRKKMEKQEKHISEVKLYYYNFNSLLYYHSFFSLLPNANELEKKRTLIEDISSKNSLLGR